MLFRPQRSSFEESMKNSKKFYSNCFYDLFNYLSFHYTFDKILISEYDNIPDIRFNKKYPCRFTLLVSISYCSSLFHAVGFLTPTDYYFDVLDFFNDSDVIDGVKRDKNDKLYICYDFILRDFIKNE